MQTDENKFTALLRRHLDNNINPEEKQELMGMIKSGLYDKQLKQLIDLSLPDVPTDRDITVDAAHRLLHKILSSEKQTAQLIPVTKSPVKYGRWLPAAAVMILLIAGWWLWHKRTGADAVVAKVENKPLPGAGVINKSKFIHLPDGSTVLLNEGSKLDFGNDFNTGSRQVVLTGEAYFDIKHDERRPFVVHTGKVYTTVLGTAFNIRAWPGQGAVTVTVTRGKVKVSDNKKEYGTITSNQQIMVNINTDDFTNRHVDAESAGAWKKDYLVLDDIPFEEAARLIGNKYHVTLILTNEDLKHCKISATFLSHENLEQVLNVVCGVMSATFITRPDNQVVINGNGCN